MPFMQAQEQGMLDWVCGGANPTRPASRWISFATGSPNDAGASDGPFQSRVTCTFAAAASPTQSATNANAMSLATATAAATVVGWNLWNSSAGGVRLAYGTATAAIGCKSGDNVVIGAGALVITLK